MPNPIAFGTEESFSVSKNWLRFVHRVPLNMILIISYDLKYLYNMVIISFN